jgi:hypothetical protein
MLTKTLAYITQNRVSDYFTKIWIKLGNLYDSIFVNPAINEVDDKIILYPFHITEEVRYKLLKIREKQLRENDQVAFSLPINSTRY